MKFFVLYPVIRTSNKISRWVEQRLGHPIVKAFNSISADSIAHGSRPKWSPERFALPVSGDDRRAKDVVIGLIDEIGFDGLDAGDLDESWRQFSSAERQSL